MCDSIFKRQMPPVLLGDDGPYSYPDGSPVPVGMAVMLAASEGISHAEARRRMVEGWKSRGNRAQRRRRHSG